MELAFREIINSNFCSFLLQKMIKTLLLLSTFANFTTASRQLPMAECLEWFPEPMSYKAVSNRNDRLHDMFQNARDLLVEKDDKLSDKLEQFVLQAMEEKNTGILDVHAIVLGYLPSVRQLSIAVLCIILSEIIFVLIWKISLFEPLAELIVGSEFIEKFRIGLSILPLLYVVGIFVTYSNLNPNFQAISDGIEMFETSNDRNFMPIKTRIHKKLEQVPCIFRRDYRSWKWDRRRSDSFLNETIGGVSYDSQLDKIWEIKAAPTSSESCSVLMSSLLKSAKVLNDSIEFREIFDEKLKLTEAFMDFVELELQKTLTIYAKALGSIEHFVAEYHKFVLFLPTDGLIGLLQTYVQFMIFVTILCTLSITVLVVVKFEVKTKIGKWMVMAPIFVSTVFSVICMVVSVALLLRVCFTLIVRDAVTANDLELLAKLRVHNFSENNQHYALNYSDILIRAANVKQTLYQVIAETDPTGVPLAIRPEFLFRPTRKYNESVERSAELVVKKYPEYLEKTCELLNSTWQTMRSHVEMGQCAEKKQPEKILEIINSTLQSACSLSEKLKKSPPNAQKIHSMAFAAWKTQMLPSRGKSVIRRSKMMDNTNPMQVYFVFENPEKKLEPTILEPLFGVGVYMLVMAPLQFLLAVHFMIVLPLLAEQEDGASEKLEQGARNNREEDEDVSVNNN